MFCVHVSLLIATMLPSGYNLLRCRSKYLRSARFNLFLFEIAAAAGLVGVPGVSGNFASFSVATSASNRVTSLSSNFSIPVIFFLGF